MKKKSLLRMGAVLLSYGFMINAMNVNTGMVVMAEEFSADEDTEPEDTTDQDIAGLTDGEENTEDKAYGNAENQNVEVDFIAHSVKSRFNGAHEQDITIHPNRINECSRQNAYQQRGNDFFCQQSQGDGDN